MSSPPEEPKPAILHDPSSRSADSNPPALPPTTVAHAPYRQNAPMIHPRLPRTDAPAAGVSDHLTTTWSQDDQGRPVTLHHSWHPNHPAREPHSSGAANYYMQRESRPHRSSPDYFQYRRPPSRQQFGYRNYEDQNRMKSQYNHRSEPSNAYYEAKRLEQEAFRKDYESKTGLLLPPHSAEIAPVAYTQPAARHVAPTNNGSGCSCKKSKCLKLYCACFSSSVLCRADCKCEGCLNSNDEVAKKDNAIQVARRAVLDRNPKAFDDKIGQSDVGIVRPVFSRAIPVRRMPEYDFRSLERVRTDSISPKEGLMPALPPLASATPAVAPVQLEEPKKTANEEGSAKESDVGDEATEEKDAPDESKDDDNATEKSEGASKSPDQTHAELASVSTSGSTSRPVVFNRNPSPHDGYYRPSPTYRQPFAWDARHYPRETELRRHSYSYYDQQSLSSMPHHSAESRMPREMHPYQYRPHTALPLTDAHLPKQHRVGCKCKKSMCLKKYCECFQNGIKCGMSCKCVNCGNKPGAVKNANGAEQTQDQATEDAVNTMVSLGQTVSLESEETPNLHRSSEDNEPSVVGRPPSLPSITSTSHHTDGEESLKENPKPGEQNLDFLATLATSALDDLKRDKRKAEEMELSRAVSLEAENKRSRASVSYDYYDNSYNQSYRWANSNEHTLKSITTQVHNQTATPAPVPKEKSTSEGTKSSKLPKGLTFRKVCSNCGRQRAEHGEFGFGNKCPLTTCGKCGADSQCHQINKVRMGVMCTLTESDGAIAGCSAKYEAVLADLAARAEIRAEIGRAE